MLTVNQTDFAGLRDGTGRPFTAFVDALIRVHGYVYGVGQAEILTTLRTNVQDGGVDTQVNQAMLGDPIGFLLLPTCWQYKARLNDTITESELRRDIRKEHSARLIEKGYAYRLAICDDMPAETQTDWRKLLTEEARKIDPNAPEALVITASQLAWWANCYPALLPAHFGHKTGPVMFFEAWSRSITKVTPKFVPVEGWRAAAGLIEDHMDLRKPAVSATLPLKGMAGVGKTRLVHEVALKNAGAAGLVLYAKDGDDAEKIARSLANDKRTRCLLVADDCSIQARVSIGNVLKGHTDRVRVVCIDNSGERALSGQAELELDALPPSVVQRVLEENFPHISFERRRAYAQLSGGYIRFAADMCERNAQIREHLGPIIDAVQEYYLDRFRDDAQRQIIEALSLVQKVGFGEGVSDELDALCYLTGQTREHVLEVARRLKDAPGFVVRTTRYLYITPEIIVRVAFLNAWRRWFEPDSTVYLSRFPPILLESFQSRVAQSASPEVRAQVGTFFRNSVADMEPGDLTNTDIVQKLATLIDTDPDQYFPRLVMLVRQAELQELRLVNGGPANRPGSRRILVWTAERLAAFERYFPGAEEVLRKLALAETEDGIRNNAKGVWSSLFRIVLSGTEFPFRKRVELLGSLLSSTTQEVSELALLALEKTLDLESPSPMGPSVVAGQLVPPDWHPNSLIDLQQCLVQALDLFAQVIANGTSDSRDRAWGCLSRHVRRLLAHGMLGTIQSIVSRNGIPEGLLPDFLQSVEHYLAYECGGNTGPLVDDFDCHAVAEWLIALTPSDFQGRLKAVVGKDPWNHAIRDDASGLPTEILQLARELTEDPSRLEAALPFLGSAEAASAALLGDALAREDPGGNFLDLILAAARTTGSSTLARGYVEVWSLVDSGNAERLNTWLDRLEADTPVVAHSISLSAARVANPTERTLRMVRAGSLPVQSLQNLRYAPVFDALTSLQLVEVLDLLRGAGDPDSLNIAIDLIGQFVQKQGDLESADLRGEFLRVLEASAPVEDRADYWWGKALTRLAGDHPEKVCQIAISGLTGKDFEKRNYAWGVLRTISKAQPNLVMRELGLVLIDDERNWSLRGCPQANVVASLPFDSVKPWLDEAGLQGAQALAHYLPAPFLSETGVPQVPTLTEFVLTKWGDDRTVFGRFTASIHHLQVYSGDIVGAHRRNAELASPFLSHAIPAIRKWAEIEVASEEQTARMYEISMEEQGLG